MLRSSLSKIVRQSPLRWYLPHKLTRMEAIQCAIDALGARRYLEIGVNDGTCFCSLTAPEKIGVDPISPQPAVSTEITKQGVHYFSLKSDDFFRGIAPQVLADGVDVVFIDGLHTFDQAYRDCMHSLDYLNPGGLILLHDCLPTSEEEARPAQSVEEARRLNGPGWNTEWTGDVWKAILRIRARHSALRGCVLECDHGIGLVYRETNESRLSLTE